MDNISQQAEEIEAISAIYGDNLVIEDEEKRSYSITIGKSIKFYFKFSDDYPCKCPPTYELSAPYFKQEEKTRIYESLTEVYLSNKGESILFQWIEKLRELIEEINSKGESISKEEPVETKADNEEIECPEIFHGEIIVDRKSSFQGHAAIVHSLNQVKIVLKTLLEVKKIQQATHNIYAYRIYKDNTYFQDCDDDGETQAGSRLLHLLQIIDIKNIIVIVSRWYGGILLGPDRFKHINNAARYVLEASNLINKK